MALCLQAKDKSVYCFLHGDNIVKSTKSLVDLNPRLFSARHTHEVGQSALKRGLTRLG